MLPTVARQAVAVAELGEHQANRNREGQQDEGEIHSPFLLLEPLYE